MPEKAELKEQVRDFWNQQSCDTQVATAAKHSLAYFEQIEDFRYRDQPFIHSFAQFTRYRGKKVLEVGFGAGTDFTQWLRAGALASGIDLTQEALDNLGQRIQTYGLPQPQEIRVADAENLPFANNTFDLGYSFGVLHHSPDTTKAIKELVRVIRPGGELKMMLYNRRSIFIYNQWIKHGLLKGKPFRSLADIMWNHVESVNTKGYTRRELAELLSSLPLTEIRIHTEPTSADQLSGSAFAPWNWCNRFLLRLAGYYHDWDSIDYVERGAKAQITEHAKAPRFSGNSLGFYHCITARKNATA